ncbi:DinB family protein [Zhihengliuella sp.]|uniref:mycothiol transferase n=1 Tax=Zhihengliuella sp. TaxID=1954483 RepID=UPI0028125B5A|nr:DinB family protein [Zhihengliuella sp.]
MERELASCVLADGFARVRETVDEVLGSTPPAHLLWQPPGGGNHIAWLIWHLSRVTDDHVAGITAVLDGAPPPRGDQWTAPSDQAWRAEWADRLGLPYDRDDFGLGHSPDDVAAFPPVAPSLLGGYHAAVQDRTEALLGRLRRTDFAVVCDERWDPPVTVAVRLASVLNDATQHVGQASYVRGLAERAGAG